MPPMTEIFVERRGVDVAICPLFFILESFGCLLIAIPGRCSMGCAMKSSVQVSVRRGAYVRKTGPHVPTFDQCHILDSRVIHAKQEKLFRAIGLTDNHFIEVRPTKCIKTNWNGSVA